MIVQRQHFKFNFYESTEKPTHNSNYKLLRSSKTSRLIIEEIVERKPTTTQQKYHLYIL